MPPTPPLIRCATPACPGVLGSWRDGDLYPSPHLVPGRHLWAEADGTLIICCSVCGREHRHGVRDGRLRPMAVTG